MQPSTPVFAAAMAIIFKQEPFSVLKILGILCAAGGAVVMIGIENSAFFFHILSPFEGGFRL